MARRCSSQDSSPSIQPPTLLLWCVRMHNHICTVTRRAVVQGSKAALAAWQHSRWESVVLAQVNPFFMLGVADRCKLRGRTAWECLLAGKSIRLQLSLSLFLSLPLSLARHKCCIVEQGQLKPAYHPDLIVMPRATFNMAGVVRSLQPRRWQLHSCMHACNLVCPWSGRERQQQQQARAPADMSG